MWLAIKAFVISEISKFCSMQLAGCVKSESENFFSTKVVFHSIHSFSKETFFLSTIAWEPQTIFHHNTWPFVEMKCVNKTILFVLYDPQRL